MRQLIEILVLHHWLDSHCVRLRKRLLKVIRLDRILRLPLLLVEVQVFHFVLQLAQVSFHSLLLVIPGHGKRIFYRLVIVDVTSLGGVRCLSECFELFLGDLYAFDSGTLCKSVKGFDLLLLELKIKLV